VKITGISRFIDVYRRSPRYKNNLGNVEKEVPHVEIRAAARFNRWSQEIPSGEY
jgi:hypothetical protein